MDEDKNRKQVKRIVTRGLRLQGEGRVDFRTKELYAESITHIIMSVALAMSRQRVIKLH